MARYKEQLNVAMERFDQGLARVHSLVKRGEIDIKPEYEEMIKWI